MSDAEYVQWYNNMEFVVINSDGGENEKYWKILLMFDDVQS